MTLFLLRPQVRLRQFPLNHHDLSLSNVLVDLATYKVTNRECTGARPHWEGRYSVFLEGREIPNLSLRETRIRSGWSSGGIGRRLFCGSRGTRNSGMWALWIILPPFPVRFFWASEKPDAQYIRIVRVTRTLVEIMVTVREVQ